MEAYTSVNPATGQLLARYPLHTPAEIGARVSACAAAAARRARTAVGERCEVLAAVAEGLRQRRAELAALMTAEMGKPIAAAEAEVDKCAACCDYYAQQAPRLLAEQEVPTEALRSYVRLEGLGPILAIMPWNFPLWQVFRFGAAALVAGNSILLKHAPNVGGCAAALEGLLAQSGAPQGLLVSIRCDNPTALALVADPAVAAVTLTGSTAAGRAVAAAAGAALKKCVLELGGSDPFIVLEDADVPRAAASAAASRCINNGQSCIAAKRFLVDRRVAGAFVEQMAAALRRHRLGDPADRNVTLGPLAREDLVAALERQVRESLDLGAELVCGGRRPDRPGYFYEPTLLRNVRPGMPVFDQETFGPVAAVTIFDNEGEAVELANRSVYGLAASIWTADTARAQRLAGALECGTVFVNAVVKSDPRLPFGGIKQSGYGRELAEYGLREFVNVKAVSLHG